jgi:hypothetical protein
MLTLGGQAWPACARSGDEQEAEPPWFGSPGERNEGRGQNEREREEGGARLVSFGTVGSVPAGPARQAGDVRGREAGETEAG